MPNIRSAKKRVRVTARQTASRRPRITAMRNAVKRVEMALTKKDVAAAADAFARAEPIIAKAAAKGALHKATASRKLSRLVKKLKAAGAPPPKTGEPRAEKGGASVMEAKKAAEKHAAAKSAEK